MAKGHSKGSRFEREVCKSLSKWWSNGKRDDIFWRTAGSGARATVRRKSGKKTFGQYGDMQATDPIGQPFIDKCVVEMKRGYNTESPLNLVDKQNMKDQFQGWAKKIQKEAKSAGTPYWLLIHKRDLRKVMVYIPYSLWFDAGGSDYDGFEYSYGIFRRKGMSQEILGVSLEVFCEYIEPQFFRTKTKRRSHTPAHSRCRRL